MSLGAAVWLAPAAVLAQTAGDSLSDEDLLSELLSVVEEGTEIATQTRMNVDFVPGMVTVLEGDLLEGLGARTVIDALALVPGVLASRGVDGSPTLIVRGVQFPFNNGNVKVTVNGLSMSREGSGVSTSVLHWPLALVDRVEIVRGPGSVLYGDYAFMGLVNIVTRAQGSALYARAADSGNLTAGARSQVRSADGDAFFSVTASGDWQRDAEVPDASGAGSDRRGFATLHAGYRGFSAALQSMGRDYDPERGPGASEGEVALRIAQQWSLGKRLSGRVHADFLDTDAAQSGIAFEEKVYELGAAADWSGWNGHLWTAKLSYVEERIGDTRFAPGPVAIVTSGEHRRGYGFAVQDQVQLTDAVSLVGGLRYDVRDDIDDERLTPRLAAIWRIDDRNMLKGQYTEGFRTPTFFELYGANGKSDLSLESVASSELSYIHRGQGRVLRLTAFHLRLDDMIFRVPDGFANAAEGESSGFETEAELQLTPGLKGLANLSFADSYTTRSADGQEREDLSPARWLGNAGLLWRPTSGVMLAAHLTYVGKRNDPAVDEELRLALAATKLDLFMPGLDVQLSLRNAAGTDESTVIEFPERTLIRAYDQRIASLTVTYGFR